MLRLILIFLVLSIIPSVSFARLGFARLGETEQENEQRFGESVENVNDRLYPVLRKATNKTYHYHGWKIRIGYLNDHAVRLRYSKLPAPGLSPILKVDEIEAILQAESHGGKWTKLGGGMLFRKKTGNKNFDSAQQRWVNSKNFIAYTPLGNMSIIVEIPEAAVWENAIDQHKENQRKEKIPKF